MRKRRISGDELGRREQSRKLALDGRKRHILPTPRTVHQSNACARHVTRMPTGASVTSFPPLSYVRYVEYESVGFVGEGVEASVQHFRSNRCRWDEAGEKHGS